MNVLFLTYGLPYPPHSGARVRDFFLLREIAKHHHVTCLALLEHVSEMQHAQGLERLGIETFGVPIVSGSRAARARSMIRHFAARYPPATLSFWNIEFDALVRALTARRSFDLVQIEHSFLSPYLDALPPALRRCSILDLHNIGALQYRSMSNLGLGGAARARAQFKTRLMQNWEVRYAAPFAHVLTVSDDDAQWLCARSAALRVSVIENGSDTASIPFLPPPSQQNILLFVGTLGYPPNADAMAWFCEEILPIIRASVPDVLLEMVGRAPRAELRSLAGRENVRLYADVSGLEPYYERASVVIVPLRAGGGTRLKILEAMAFGRPVVSTRIGSEGLDVQDGETLLLADTPHDFAARVIYLLDHPAEGARLARNARSSAETHYAWERIGTKLLRVYDEVVASGGETPPLPDVKVAPPTHTHAV